MKLKAVEMQGFKSFPDRTKLTFDDGITVIVGPNGSGKSNISDAIKWVFGEQSVKSLRGAKMEDVIFGGSISRKPTGFAWVSLFIDNTDRSIDIDSDEVVITRRLYRSGESEYRINNNPVRLRDINEMFMDTGLGRDGYSVIERKAPSGGKFLRKPPGSPGSATARPKRSASCSRPRITWCACGISCRSWRTG